jgi:hypothetical protein
MLFQTALALMELYGTSMCVICMKLHVMNWTLSMFFGCLKQFDFLICNLV